MNKPVLSIDAQASAPKERFHSREFRRVAAMCFQFPGPLLLGLLATVVFACLHTVSIGAAFPVFKMLLDDEGVPSWVDRYIAGERIGARLSRPSGTDVQLISIDADSDLFQQGLRAGDRLADPRARPARQWLHDVASHDSSKEIVLVTDDKDPASRRGLQKLRASPRPLTTSRRMLLLATSWLPEDLAQNRLTALGYILAVLVCIIITANLFRYLGEVWIAKAVLRAMMRLRSQLYERTLQLPMAFFASRQTADLVGRFVHDMQEIQRGVLTLFSKFIREPLRAVLVLGFAFFLDWRLTLTVVLATPIAILVFWQVGRRVKRSNRKLSQTYGEMIGALTASLQNLRVVKAYTAEDQERARLREVDRKVLRQQLKLARLQAMVSPAIESVAVVACSFLTLWLANQVLNRELEMSMFATLGVALSVLFDPVRKLTDVYVRVQRSTAGAERVFQVIDAPIERNGAADTIELAPLERSMDFSEVTFSYPLAETPALDRVSLSIQRGETVALVGPNGCGKTTLVSMLLRLYTADAGVIRYDGVDLRDASLESLRRQFSLVTQDAVVFGTTPAENIAYGADDADPQRIREAARRASADKFIEAMPDGYETPLGERGTTMSGGQRQRLAIARAVYRDAPILIFDEATSQVDAESEREIQRAIRNIAKDRTTIIIAHRLSTIQFADRIVAMDAGRIEDTGTHEELLKRCAMYRTVCETQLGDGAGTA